MKKKKHARLTDAYNEFRKNVSQQEEEKAVGLEGDELEKLTDEIIRANRESFSAELSEFLGQEQAKRALFLLGSLNERWDGYLDLLIGFGLQEDALNKASGSVYEYISEYLEERKKASEAGTRLSGRTATRMKAELDEKIAVSLSEEQYAEWSRSTAFKRKSN